MYCNPNKMFVYFRTVGVVIASLVLNGIGIGGQQVAGVVDAMREAV